MGLVRCWPPQRAGRRRSCRLGISGGEPLEDASRDALQFAEARQIVLKFLIHGLRLFRAQLYPQDHVPELHGMRQERLFLQFFQRGSGIVVVHEFSPAETIRKGIILARRTASQGSSMEEK